MSDNLKPDTENDTDAAIAGLRLAEARRAQDISVLDIANELHLDELKVRALEENRFDVLGAPVFAKGHLRKYAELVGVSTDDVMADYYLLNSAVGTPPVVGPPRKRERDYDIGHWVTGAVIVIAVVGVASAGYWWLKQREAEPALQAGSMSQAPFVSSADTVAEIPQDSNPASGLTEDVAPVAIDVADAQAETASPTLTSNNDGPSLNSAPPLAGVPQASLTMRFIGDCWTEVSDASGTRLYFDLGRAGSDVTVSGEAPLRALFGDSANVRVAINGQDFVIPDSMRNGRTARLTVNAQ